MNSSKKPLSLYLKKASAMLQALSSAQSTKPGNKAKHMQCTCNTTVLPPCQAPRRMQPARCILPRNAMRTSLAQAVADGLTRHLG
jgi:hypothetical protein